VGLFVTPCESTTQQENEIMTKTPRQQQQPQNQRIKRAKPSPEGSPKKVRTFDQRKDAMTAGLRKGTKGSGAN